MCTLRQPLPGPCVDAPLAFSCASRQELSWVNMGASAPAGRQPAATGSHVPHADPGVIDPPVNDPNDVNDPRVHDPRVRAVAEALSRPGLWAVILNVPAPPPANPLLRGLISLAAAATGAQRRHWLGLRRFGGTWCVLSYQGRRSPSNRPLDQILCVWVRLQNARSLVRNPQVIRKYLCHRCPVGAASTCWSLAMGWNA